MQDRIVVYGTDWCEDTRRTRSELESLGVQYDYIDVERDPEANERVREWNGGRRVTPVVVLPSGNVVTGEDRLSAPSRAELVQRLEDHRLGR